METQMVKRVVVAGGGTAGWIAAAALAKQLGPLIEIVLVESDEIGTIGVGEATIPTVQAFHKLLGIDEAAFMRETQATFKLGISFEDWASLGDRYIHSFGQIGRSTWMGDFQHMWLEAKAQGWGGDIGDYCYELQAAMAGKFQIGTDSRLNYAYHFDATRYAGFLRRFSEGLGVQRMEGRISEIGQDAQSGDIRSLLLDSGQLITGDLFIDCTGFRGLLIEQTLKTGYEDWSRWLPMNSALAVQTEAVRPAQPYTRAIAHRAGWQWQIPLQHRVGNGVVYCSDYLADADAQDLLLQRIEGAPITEPRKIRFVTGRRNEVWNRNCIALGLASGFIEPLESTSIHLIMIGVTRLIQAFPFGGCNAALRSRYNQQARIEMEGTRDFVMAHYKLTERNDTPFWRWCQAMEVPDTLAQRIALFREDGHAFQEAHDLFRVDSWVQVMLGQRVQPVGRHRMGQLMPPAQMRQALDSLKGNIAKAVAALPDHADFVRGYCPATEPSAPVSETAGHSRRAPAMPAAVTS